MVRFYYYDDIDGDQRDPHEGAPATVDDLEEVGVFCSNIQDLAEVDRIAEKRGYNHRDEVQQSHLRSQRPS